MKKIRDTLNKLKWCKGFDLKRAEIWYRHRGAPGGVKVVYGRDIVSIGKTFMETKTSIIPYHRVLRITYRGKVLFDRGRL